MANEKEIHTDVTIKKFQEKKNTSIQLDVVEGIPIRKRLLENSEIEKKVHCTPISKQIYSRCTVHNQTINETQMPDKKQSSSFI